MCVCVCVPVFVCNRKLATILEQFLKVIHTFNQNYVYDRLNLFDSNWNDIPSNKRKRRQMVPIFVNGLSECVTDQYSMSDLC